jgi:SAM-dependent methyltransferase
MRETDRSFQVSPEEFKNRIREHWNRTETRDPNTSRFGTPSEITVWKDFFSKELGEKKLRILDVGTGTGFLSLSLAELGHEVVGVDLAEGMISFARKMADERGLNLDLEIGDAESLDFYDESFDAVVSRWVLWTLPDPEKAITEWMRVLKPGGRAFEFGISRPAEKAGLWRQITWNLWRFPLMTLEGRNAWIIGSRYGKDLDGKRLEEKLPLHYIKPGSNAKEREFFEKHGFVDITTTLMEEVDRPRKKQKIKTLRHILAWGVYDKSRTYCLSGRKPMTG